MFTKGVGTRPGGDWHKLDSFFVLSTPFQIRGLRAVLRLGGVWEREADG